MKKIYKILIVVILAISVCGNIYYCGLQMLKNEKAKAYNQGSSDTGLHIFNFVKENGSIIIRKDNEDLILIEKK